MVELVPFSSTPDVPVLATVQLARVMFWTSWAVTAGPRVCSTRSPRSVTNCVWFITMTLRETETKASSLVAPGRGKYVRSPLLASMKYSCRRERARVSKARRWEHSPDALTLAASNSEIRFIAIHRARLSAFDAELMSDGWSEMSRWLGSTVKFVKYS